jgi:putative heme-binding domain-containing protein
LAAVAKREPAAADLVARALGRPFAKDRPRPDDLPAWLKRLEGPADAAPGRRVFFHPRLAACSRCHRVEGRGADIGPDLSAVGRTERRHVLESILQPSNLVAPHYQVWSITTANGKEYSGMLLRTVLDEYTYVDAKGDTFKLNTRDIVEARATPRSVMPDGLTDLLTDQELRDLLAYLASRR